MTLARANPLGWAYNEELTSAQMNALDSQLPYALDGGAGGIYAPTDYIEIDNTNGGGIKWGDGTGANWPTVSAREAMFWQNIGAVLFSTNFNTTYEPFYMAQGFKDWENAGGAAPSRPERIAQTYTHASNIPKIGWQCNRFPYGCLVKGIGVRIYQPNASIGSIQYPPQLDVTSEDYASSGAPSAVGSPAVASATYNGSLTDLEVVITPQTFDGKKLVAFLSGEGGTNSQTDMQIIGLYLRVNVSQVRY